MRCGFPARSWSEDGGPSGWQPGQPRRGRSGHPRHPKRNDGAPDAFPANDNGQCNSVALPTKGDIRAQGFDAAEKADCSIGGGSTAVSVLLGECASDPPPRIYRPAGENNQERKP